MSSTRSLVRLRGWVIFWYRPHQSGAPMRFEQCGGEGCTTDTRKSTRLIKMEEMRNWVVSKSACFYCSSTKIRMFNTNDYDDDDWLSLENNSQLIVWDLLYRILLYTSRENTLGKF
jgi:hypothetical protein